MAKRIITAAIAVPFALVLFFLDNTVLFVISMAALSGIATYEILVATKYVSNKAISITSITFASVIPIALSINELKPYIPTICFGFLLVLFIILLAMHEKVRFEEVSLMAFISVCIPLSLSTIAFFQIYFVDHGIFYIVFVLGSAWLSDAGAYFVGTAFGKHKMAPTISPKKSWEGFVGGIITAGITSIVISLGYEFYDVWANGTHTFTINIPYLFVLSLICAALGVLGDFTASIIKRQCSIKDFGNILPGHGGVLDRFDSVLFVAPFVYLLFKVFEPITQIV